MKKDIINETAKPGVEQVDHSNPLNKNKLVENEETGTEHEQDEDELVHELSQETPNAESEQDLDELVHRVPPTKTVRDNEEKDPDDLVHGK
jgi:hypothetical protein